MYRKQSLYKTFDQNERLGSSRSPNLPSLRPPQAVAPRRPRDLAKEISRITSYIAEEVEAAGSEGIVVGISGGVDSSVTAALCRNAIGAHRVIGVLLFENSQKSSDDMEDARAVARKLRIKTYEINLSPMVEDFASSLRLHGISPSKITVGNVKARSRMTILYSLANHMQLLVAGTGDKSEMLLGYFTKYGDGAADILPIAHLFKTEVRAIGARLGLPPHLVNKPASPNLWIGQKACDELPADYVLLDQILALLLDCGMDSSELSKILGLPARVACEVAKTLRIPARVVKDVSLLYVKNAHKRELPKQIPS